MASNIDVLNESTRVAQEAAKVAGLNFQPGATVVGGQIKPTNIPAPLINTNQADLKFQNQNVNADLPPYLASVIATRDALASQEEKALKQEQQSYISELKGLQSRQESKPLAMNEALDKAGVTKITKEMQDLEGQIATRTAALESGLTNIEGKAIPMELLTGEQAQLRRQGLAEIGTLQARQQVLQGNLAAAKDAAQRAVDLIYAPEEARIKNIQTFLELNQAELTKEEKKKADLLTEALRVQSEELANKKTLQAYALNASANYPDAGILPSDDVQTVNNKIQGSRIYKTERARAEDLAGLGGGGGTGGGEVVNVPGVGGVNPSALALANQYASSGKLPSSTDLKSAGTTFGEIAELAKLLPKQEGTIVDVNTNTKPDTSDSVIGGYSAMFSAIKLAEQLKELDKKRWGGVISGTIGGILGSADQKRYLDTRKQIVDLLARARTGAAMTPSEEKFYSDMLPGRFDEPFGIGADSQVRIDNFIKNLSDDTRNKAKTQGWAVTGLSTVNLGGTEYKVGDIITNEAGQRGRVLPDGSILQI